MLSNVEAVAAAVVGGKMVKVDYTNYRGARNVRRVEPRRIWFGSTDFHPTPQWLMDVFDVDRGAIRTFALQDIHGFG